MNSHDFSELDQNGFIIVRQLVAADDIAEFEDAVARFSRTQIEKRGIARRAGEPFIDVFLRGGAYTDRIYKLLERLAVLTRMSVGVERRLEAEGFMKWAGIEVPLVWPDIRADIPNDTVRALAVHQDFGSMQSHRAWRTWIALRPANSELGTMALYPGTHKLGVIHHNFEDKTKPVVDPAIYADVKPVVLDLPAGDGVILSPLCLHASVQNRSSRTKFTLMVQVQDYASVIDPDDAEDQYADFARFAAARARSRAAAAG
jgi:ectoine hydroxylase-related dioxygenase (phytanoyl-CoA dioxygenase family)